MADLRKETHGAGSMKDVELVVLGYDNRVATKDGEIITHYLDARIHPDDRRAPGQTNLALVSKPDPKATSGFNNSARYSASQFAAIVAAAGDNVTDLLNTSNEVVGKIYGVKADLLISSGDVIINTQTLKASDLSIGPAADGRDIRTRIFDSMKAAKQAKTAAPTTEAEAPAAEATVAEPAAKPATKPRAAAKPRTSTKAKAPKPELVGATAGAPSADEPELG